MTDSPLIQVGKLFPLVSRNCVDFTRISWTFSSRGYDSLLIRSCASRVLVSFEQHWLFIYHSKCLRCKIFDQNCTHVFVWNTSKHKAVFAGVSYPELVFVTSDLLKFFSFVWIIFREFISYEWIGIFDPWLGKVESSLSHANSSLHSWDSFFIHPSV